MGIVSNGIASAGGTDTSDATAKAWDIKTGKTAYIATGSATGTGYFPALMTFNGTTGYYSDTYTSSGNKVTVVARFNRASFTGSSNVLFRAQGPTTYRRCQIICQPSNHADTDRQSRIQISVANSANTVVCLLFASAGSYLDGENHTLFFSYDGDAGTASFYIDGTNADDTGNADRVAPTTATLDAGASSTLYIGADSGVPALLFAGNAGFIGMRDAYLTNWSDFMQADGTPKDIDESGWTEWGAQPLYWHESGLMTENKGSGGNMTANGTIILAAASTWS